LNYFYLILIFKPFKRSSFKENINVNYKKFRRKSHIWRLNTKKKIYKILSANFNYEKHINHVINLLEYKFKKLNSPFKINFKSN
jgi:hypothetical protein